MIHKVAFTLYPVEDAFRARKFYEETLGLVRGKGSPDGVWTEYDLPGGGCFALFKGGDGKPSATAGGTIAFEVDDRKALVERLRADGVTIKHEHIPSPVCDMSIVLDTEGNAIILHELHKK